MLQGRELSFIKNKKTILNNISLEITKGESVGLVGPNGSGKSSLLKLLALLEPPTSGKILFNDREFSTTVPLEIRRRIAIVFQEPLLLNMNVYHNVAAGLKMRRLPKAQIQKTVSYWLESFGIIHLIKQHAYSLSGGEAQRVSLARAFALDPEILFLDEPFSSLDAPTTEELLQDLKRIFLSTGITTVLVSHNFREIKTLTDRIYVMQTGQIMAEGSTAEILSSLHSSEDRTYMAPWK